jgi:TP901 family phage tail tape measure protein
MGSAAVLGVLVRAKGIGAVNSQLSGLNANMAKTGASAGRASSATSTLGRAASGAAGGLRTASGAATQAAGGNRSLAGAAGQAATAMRGAAGASTAQASASRAGAAAATQQATAMRGAAGSSAAMGGAAGAAAGGLKRVGLAAGITGAASLLMGVKFDESMQKIVSLVGVSQKQVDAWKKELLTLGPQVGKSPRELADALFFVTSAGIEGAEAIDVLTISAKASAAGLGETKVVADAVTSAMNAYGSDVITAGQATDVLTVAVREGKLEASALAPAIGTVVPLASAMGVEFHEVAGAMAAMSRTGTDAANAATQTRAILAGLVKPAKGASDTMKALGTSADEVRKSIRERGLLVTLQDLMERTDGNQATMAKLFPNVRALSGVLDLLGGNAEGNVAVFDAVSKSAGATDKAFQDTRSAGFYLKQVLALLEATVIRVGGAVSKLVVFFAENREAVTALLAVIAAVGTAWVVYKLQLAAAVIGTKLATVATLGFAGAMRALGAAMLANPAMLIAAAIAVLVAGLVVAYRESETFRAIVTGAWEAIKKVVAAAVAFIVPVVTTAWNAIKTVTSVVWGAIKTVITVVWQAITAVITVQLAVIRAVITTAWTVIKAVTTTVWGAIEKVITAAWAGIKVVTTASTGAIKSIITASWNAIKKVTTVVWGAIAKLLSMTWDKISGTIKTALRLLVALITMDWNTIGSITRKAWTAIREFLRSIWNSIKTLVTAALSALKSAITSTWGAIKSVTSTAWAGIRTAIMNPVRSASEWVIAKVAWLADRLQAGFRSIWGIATDFAGGLRDRITNGFKGAVNAVGKFVGKIIDVVNKIPGIPDIKFKFTPLAQGGQFSAAGAAGAVPEQVQALARGGMVNRPTVLVGEEGPAHPEFVIPTNPAYRGRATELMASAAQKMGMEGFARGGVLGNADTFASVAKKMGAGAKSTLALFMAGVVESGMRNLTYGDRDSRGILQIRDGTARGMGINNMSVAQSAAAFLGRGFWNKGSAMSLSKSGMTAGQVAQNTQGSAFPARYDQERGRALGYLKSAKGDKKGLGDLLKGAMGAVGDVASALNPMDFISKLPGVGDLPGWIQGLGKHAISGVTGWIRDKVASIIPSGGGGDMGDAPGGLGHLVRVARNMFGLQVTSGYRPGDPGMHGKNRARDVSNSTGPTPQMMGFAKHLAANYGSRLKELIYTPWGKSIKNGKVTPPYAQAAHYNHVHFAMKEGGVLGGRVDEALTDATLARQAMTHRSAVMPFVGSYATGGTVPRDGMALVHKGERVTPPGRSDGPMVHIENYNVTDAAHDEERLARKVGFRMRALGAID